jgi:hypothetical protein
MNTRSRPGTSRFKGVCRKREKWRAQIVKDGKQKSLGTYTTEEAAAHSYDRAALEMFGEFANLNFPERIS